MDTSDQYFNCICRTCMNDLPETFSQDVTTKEQQQWQSIFDRIEECGAFRIAELLSNAVPQIEVHLNDELPKRICCKCLQQLLNVYGFQQICVQSDQQMRQQISKKRSDLQIPKIEVAMEGEIRTNDAGSYPLTNQNLEDSLIQKQVVKSEQVESKDVDIDQFQENCRDSVSNLSEHVKNEPMEHDETSIEYSDGEITQSAISVKNEGLSVEIEEQQINETNVKAHHIEDKPYECPYCPRRFSKYAYMCQHKKRHEGAKREACDICGKSFSKTYLKQHKLTHGDEKPHKCDLCDKSFVRMTNLRDHMRSHTGEKLYKCEYCERFFSYSCDHKQHMRLHLGENIHKCELCPLTFPAPSELRVHFTTHKNEDPETRERNMKASKEAEAMLQLKISKQQFEIKNKICIFCRKKYQSLTSFTEETLKKCKAIWRIRAKYNLTHNNVSLPLNPGQIECYHIACYRKFTALSKKYRQELSETASSTDVLQEEIDQSAEPSCSDPRDTSTADDSDKTAEIEGPIRSEARQKIAKSESTTDVPQEETEQPALYSYPKDAKASRIIEGEDYECPYCPRRFRTKRYVRQHKVIHEEAKRETCDICGKSIRKKDFKRHKRIHSDSKVHKCAICEQSFARKSDLKTHMRQHSGEKPYKCNYCESSFVRPDHCRSHMRRHLGDNVYRCEFCPLAFPAAKELNVHLTEHKNEDLETRERNMRALQEAEANLQLKLSKNSTRQKTRNVKKNN